MLLARGNAGADEVLVIGLSRGNVDRLTSGQPILMRRETHGEGVPEGWQIAICFAETETELRREFVEAGMVTDNTKVMIDKRLTDA